MEGAAPEGRSDSLSVPWPDIVRFVRQLSHDLRNQLNAADLAAAYINELAADAELKTEIKRLRETISAAAITLQKLSAAMGQARTTLMPYGASEFMEDLQKKMANDFPEQSAEIHWEVETSDATLEIDPQLLQQALLELFSNAFRHDRAKGALTATGKIDNGRFVFTLREPKTRFELPTGNWGREPLRSVAPGHYGLGLNRVRAIIEAHGGDLRARYEPGQSVLVTTITLPLSARVG
jgi:OmpR-family two-component system manganese-sensing sensor histidine kinase